MRTVRRLYFYLVTFIALEMVIWGAISLAQTLLEQPPGGAAAVLSSGLALVLVGVPVFLLHGAAVQRDAARDPEERANRLRAIFFYAVRLATQIPLLTNAIFVAVRLLLGLLGLPSLYSSYLGVNQSLVIDLTTMAGNGLAWYAALRLLRVEEGAITGEGSPLEEVGRLYRYLWMVLTLAVAAWGVGAIVLYFINTVGLFAGLAQNLVNGLACASVGTPLWALAWLGCERGLERPEERSSLLRAVVLYGLALGPALFFVILGVQTLSGLLNLILGQEQSLAAYLLTNSNSLAALLPLGVIWAFFRRGLGRDWVDEADSLRRAMRVRLYRSLLAALGNAVTFFGAWQLLTFLVDLAFNGTAFSGGLRQQLSMALAGLGVGLWVWLPNWLGLQAESGQAGETGDHARRSIQRRTYLYVAVFLSIVGVMVNAGTLLYRLFNAGLGNEVPNLGLESAHSLANLALFGVWLVYHQSALRADGRQAQAALAQRQADYPVLLLTDGDAEFQAELEKALKSAAPGLRLIIQASAEGSPPGDPAQFKAVVLPAGLDPIAKPEVGRWLAEFKGMRLVAPLPAEGQVWLGLPPRSRRELARETAQALRQLAEGEPLRQTPPNNPWVIAGYVFGGLFALELLLVAATILDSILRNSG